MPNNNHGDGPIQYDRIAPCPPTNPQVTLSLPPLVVERISDEQRARIALIEIDFARRVSRAMQRSYEEVAVVLGGQPRTRRRSEGPKE